MRLKIIPSEMNGVNVARGIQFFLDGEEVHDVEAADVSYRHDAIVVATLKVHVSPETIEANPLLSMQSLMEAADFYGLKLVEK